jgi:hypothetical protein
MAENIFERNARINGGVNLEELQTQVDELANTTPVAAVVNLTDAATITTDASLADHFRVTLGGNRTLANPTSATDGQRILFEITQDNAGSRTLTLGNKFVFGEEITAVTLSTAANKKDFIGVQYNLAADKFYVIAVAKGY